MATAVTGSACSDHVCMGTGSSSARAGSRSVARDHAETTVSSPAVTSAEPSEANAIAETALKCAGHVRTSRPVDTSHTYAAPVTEPAAKCDPSGLAATTAMGSPTKNVCSGDSLSKPHTSRAFFETRAETAKIGIEGGGRREGGAAAGVRKRT